MHAFNFDEIDTWGQFHQHFTSNFFSQRSLSTKDAEELAVFFFALLGSVRVKAYAKMLVKSTFGDCGFGSRPRKILAPTKSQGNNKRFAL